MNRIGKYTRLALLLFGIYGLVSLSGCDRSGCTDPDAANFDPDASKNDGSCTYNSGEFNLKVALKFGNADLVRSQYYTDPMGYRVKFDGLKFFLSHVMLLDGLGNKTELSEVVLVNLEDPSSQTLSARLPAQTVAGVKFGIGLNYDLNHTDPISYASDHPMSTSTGMYWSWATQYIFCKLDALADTTAGGLGTDLVNLVYHTGRDTLFREKTIMGLNSLVENGKSNTVTLTLDLQKVLYGPTDTIRYWQPGQNVTHSEDLQLNLAERVTNNYVTAFE